MADFSLTTLFVTTTSQTTLPNNTNPEELTAGQLGIFIPVTSGSTGGSGMEGGSTRERNRVILREAWNGTAACNKNNKFSIL